MPTLSKLMPVQPQMLGAGCQLAVQDISGPAAYVTGGVTYSANTWALFQLVYLMPMNLSQSGNFAADPISVPGPGSRNVKVKWFTSAGVEVGNGVNLSAETVRVLAIGM
jgi:hypothetical protein